MAGNGTSVSSNGIGAEASFHFPIGIAVVSIGNVSVAGWMNFIRKIDSTDVSPQIAVPRAVHWDKKH